MCEENLRVGGRLVGEEDDEWRSLFSQDGPESEIDLGETGCSSLSV